jgi:hypothetical protein
MEPATDFMELIIKFDDEPKNYELAFKIAKIVEGRMYYDFQKYYKMGKFDGYFIHKFIDAVVDKRNVTHYVYNLLRVYGAYLRDGIALVAFTETDKELECIERWCRILYINFNKVNVNRYVEEYCLTHRKIVGEDDLCADYWDDYDDENNENNCEIMYGHTFEQHKIILHDEFHTGTFEELNFEWKDSYVDGGYVAI